MGLFDTLHLEQEHPLIKCKEGHPLVVFQTKTFACMLDNYIIKNGDELHQTYEIIEADEEYSVPKGTPLEACNYTGSADIHTNCNRCPTIYVRSIIKDRPWISEHQPSCKFALMFKNGLLKDVEVLLQESVDDIKERLKKSSLFPEMVDSEHPDVIKAKNSYLKR